MLIMFFVHRCQFRLSALLYFKKNPSVMMKRRKDLFKKKKKVFPLKVSSYTAVNLMYDLSCTRQDL